MLVHCNSKFRPYIIQFLYPKDGYIKRSLEIGYCPHCLHHIAKLVQTRISDNYTFETYYSRKKAERIIKELSKEIEYTSNDIPKSKGLFGFRYGETKEVKKDGETYLEHKACDFYGNKELVERKKFP